MPTFFKTPPAFRSWLQKNAASASELIVGFYKRDSGKPSITWPESVDEALCFGWIDGVRRGIDAVSYQIRFTPRKPTSTWSAVNIERVQVLQAEGRMTPAGLAAFERRSERKSRTYAYEQAEHAELEPAMQEEFRQHPAAWAYFQQQPPSYRHRAAWHVLSAQRPPTRQARLAKLIALSADHQRL